MKSRFIAVVLCLVFFGAVHPVYACMKYGESVSVSFTRRKSTIDFDRLKPFLFLRQNEPNELRYQSAADRNLVVIISRLL